MTLISFQRMQLIIGKGFRGSLNVDRRIEMQLRNHDKTRYSLTKGRYTTTR